MVSPSQHTRYVSAIFIGLLALIVAFEQPATKFPNHCLVQSGSRPFNLRDTIHFQFTPPFDWVIDETNDEVTLTPSWLIDFRDDLRDSSKYNIGPRGPAITLSLVPPLIQPDVFETVSHATSFNGHDVLVTMFVNDYSTQRVRLIRVEMRSKTPVYIVFHPDNFELADERYYSAITDFFSLIASVTTC